MKKTSIHLYLPLLLSGIILLSLNAKAQVNDCDPNGIDSALTLRNYSLMHEDVKFKQFESAYEPWLYILKNAPCHKEQFYVDGIEIYEWKYAQAKDSIRKKQLLDTMVLIYQRRIQYFGREGYVKGKWGNMLLDLDKKNPEAGLALIEESLRMDSIAFENSLIVPYFNTLVALEKKKLRKKEDVLAAYEKLTEIIDYNIKHPGTSPKLGLYKSALTLSGLVENTFTSDKAETLKEGMVLTFKASYSSPRYTITNIDSIDITVDKAITEPEGSAVYTVKEAWEVAQENLNSLAAPYLDCETLTNIYTPKYNADPANVELMEKILLFLSNARCTGTDLYFKVSESYLKLNPNAAGYRNLASAYRAKKNNSRALEIYQKAVDNESDVTLKVNDYIVMAKVALANRNHVQAKNYAEKALALNPNKGEAYILIGDAYLQAANGCAEFDANAIYWVVVDQYIKAKNVDSGIAGAANRRIATYSNYFPTKNDAFFRSIHEGDTYTLNCYPSLSTKARFVK